MAFYCLYIMSTQILVFIIMQHRALLLKSLNGKISENERETPNRSSHLQISFKIGVLKNSENLTGKQQCWSLFLTHFQ